jgi:hypothetical protein
LFGELKNSLNLFASGDSGLDHWYTFLLLIDATKLEIICDIIISGFERYRTNFKTAYD